MRSYIVILFFLLTSVSHRGWGLTAKSTWQKMQTCPVFLRSEATTEKSMRLITSEELSRLFISLNLSPLGQSFSYLLKNYMETGLAPVQNQSPLEIYIVQDSTMATSAEFYESGRILLKESAIERIAKSQHRNLDSQTVIDLSFVIHEATHAIAYALHLKGEFPLYSAHTKVNEALAYYAQGFFLKQMKQRGLFRYEASKIPAWDRCVHTFSEILSSVNITPDTDYDDAMEILFNLQLEAFEDEVIPDEAFAHLTNLYDGFLAKNKQTWLKMGHGLTPIPVVTHLTNLITEEVDDSDCQLHKTFDYMSSRIPLYSALSDLPNSSQPCDYFKSFAKAVVKHLPFHHSSYADFQFWLFKKERQNFIKTKWPKGSRPTWR